MQEIEAGMSLHQMQDIEAGRSKDHLAYLQLLAVLFYGYLFV